MTCNDCSVDLSSLDDSILGDNLDGSEFSIGLFLNKQDSSKGARAQGAVNHIILQRLIIVRNKNQTKKVALALGDL